MSLSQWIGVVPLSGFDRVIVYIQMIRGLGTTLGYKRIFALFETFQALSKIHQETPRWPLDQQLPH